MLAFYISIKGYLSFLFVIKQKIKKYLRLRDKYEKNKTTATN